MVELMVTDEPFLIADVANVHATEPVGISPLTPPTFAVQVVLDVTKIGFGVHMTVTLGEALFTTRLTVLEAEL